MTEARQVFEAMMRGNGHADLTRTGDKYNVPSLQTRWRYFLLGWEMSAVVRSKP